MELFELRNSRVNSLINTYKKMRPESTQSRGWLTDAKNPLVGWKNTRKACKSIAQRLVIYKLFECSANVPRVGLLRVGLLRL